MSEKYTKTDVANLAAHVASFGVVVSAFVVDRMKAAHVELHTGTPLWDQFVDHAGNVVVGGMLAFATVKGVEYFEKKAGRLTMLQRLVGAGALGLAVGAAFNAIPDTQAGMDHVGKHLYHCEQPNPKDDGPYCTVDPADFAWGTVSTSLLTFGLAEWRRREDELQTEQAPGPQAGQ